MPRVGLARPGLDAIAMVAWVSMREDVHWSFRCKLNP